MARTRVGFGFGATGKPLDAQVTHIWDFANGKITRFQQYTDTWQFAQLTGVEHPV